MAKTDHEKSLGPVDTFIVVVTHNRSPYLAQLLESIRVMAPPPRGLVVVDNASADETRSLIDSFAATMPPGFVTNHRLSDNIGGSGGFSAGVEVALGLGAQWVWMMDDDVSVLPAALLDLGHWTERFKCLHGRRWNHDGTPFFWQTRINEFLGIFYPHPGDVFKNSGYFLTNCGTFEGMLIHRDIVAEIGLPDPRFFLTWDDAVYAWLASRLTDVAYVDEFVLTRLRPQRSISLGIRHLNDSSDLSRFYVLRNRGYVAHYLAAHGAYNRVGFAVGTFLTFAKEMLRAVAVEHHLRGIIPIVQGYHASRDIRNDASWTPMQPWRTGQG